jgi:siroheme synthase-like protein
VSPCLDPDRLIGKSCLVVGGGIIAARPLGPLLEGGARVTVVSPRLAPALLEAARDGRLRWWPREYACGDVAGFALVIPATDDDGVNARVAAEARERSPR